MEKSHSALSSLSLSQQGRDVELRNWTEPSTRSPPALACERGLIAFSVIKRGLTLFMA